MNRLISKITLIAMWLVIALMAYESFVLRTSTQAHMNVLLCLSIIQLSFRVMDLENQLEYQKDKS